jgi:hypothetical protein
MVKGLLIGRAIENRIKGLGRVGADSGTEFASAPVGSGNREEERNRGEKLLVFRGIPTAPGCSDTLTLALLDITQDSGFFENERRRVIYTERSRLDACNIVPGAIDVEARSMPFDTSG